MNFIIKNIIFALIIFLLFFSFLEGSSRLYLHLVQNKNPLTIYDEDLGYKLNPKYDRSKPDADKEKSVNSQGLIGSEFDFKREKDTFRVITVGGSTTAGHAVTHYGTYPFYLQHLLNQQLNLNQNNWKKTEVLNAGVWGYTSEQVKKYIHRDLIELKPDLFVIMTGWNDIGKSFNKRWRPSLLIDYSKKPYNSLALIVVIKLALNKVGLIGTYDEIIYTFNEKALNFYKNNLEVMAKELTVKKIDALLVKLPVAVDRNFKISSNKPEALKSLNQNNIKAYITSVERYNSAIEEIGAKFNIQVVNSGFELDVAGKPIFFTDLLHCNFPGNRILAFNVFEAIYNKVNGKEFSFTKDFAKSDLYSKYLWILTELEIYPQMVSKSKSKMLMEYLTALKYLKTFEKSRRPFIVINYLLFKKMAIKYSDKEFLSDIIFWKKRYPNFPLFEKLSSYVMPRDTIKSN